MTTVSSLIVRRCMLRFPPVSGRGSRHKEARTRALPQQDNIVSWSETRSTHQNNEYVMLVQTTLSSCVRALPIRVRLGRRHEATFLHGYVTTRQDTKYSL